MARHWVVGGEYTSTDFREIKDGGSEERLGPFDSYKEAYKVWASRSWAAVDDAHVRYRIVEEVTEGELRDETPVGEEERLRRSFAGRAEGAPAPRTRALWHDATLAFSAGALGGLAGSLVAWLSGALGLAAALGVALAPALTPGWLYPRLVWGGIWGFLFLLPVLRRRWWLRGLVLSLGPTAGQLLVVLPVKEDKGMLGLALGAATPFLVAVFNAVWGLVAAWWLRRVGRA